MILMQNQFTLKVGREHKNFSPIVLTLSPGQSGGNRGLYTYFRYLPRLWPLSPLPPTPLLQRVLSSVLYLSLVIAPQYYRGKNAGKKISIRAAAEACETPFSTLRDRMKGATTRVAIESNR